MIQIIIEIVEKVIRFWILGFGFWISYADEPNFNLRSEISGESFPKSTQIEDVNKYCSMSNPKSKIQNLEESLLDNIPAA